MKSFKDLNITKQYINALEDLGFEAATPIQEQAIPAIKSGRPVIGIAQTGTGKTAAYILPILQLLSYPQGNDARCIVIVPTKELVVQVVEQIEQLATYTQFRVVGIYGGVGRKAQAQAIHDGIDIIVSTPRRLLKLHAVEGIRLRKIKIMVLDEADRMMDMGFLPQINNILDIVPIKKQNLLFSATFSPKVEELSWNFMDNPIKIEITPEATPVETVEQICYNVPNFETKLNLITHLLQDKETFSRIIIFVKTKKSANGVFRRLKKTNKDDIRLIHSNKGQNTRINAFNDFKEGDIRILVTTDVMARGIDIKDVSHVINFDIPTRPEDYVHRIGRTGRAFQKGAALSFVSPADKYLMQKIEKKIRMTLPITPLPDAIEVTETPFEEQQKMNRRIDAQKRKEDPNFKGAFHEKKYASSKKRGKKKKKKGGNRSPKSGFKKSRRKKRSSKKHRNKKK